MNLTQPFNTLAAWAVTKLPASLSQFVTLGSAWYNNNGYFKFAEGQKLDILDPMIFGYGLTPQGWKVLGHQRGETDLYVVETDKGHLERHYKWNIENHFGPAPEKSVPLDPSRFQRHIG